MQSREALFLSLMVTNCSGKRFFSRFKRIRDDLKGRNIQERLSTLSILYIKSDKLRQKNCNDFLDKFCYEEGMTKPFQLFTVVCSALLDSMIVASSGHRLVWWGADAISLCNEPNASQDHIAYINHFRIRTFTRKQI